MNVSIITSMWFQCLTSVLGRSVLIALEDLQGKLLFSNSPELTEDLCG